MFVGVCRLSLFLSDNDSLKGKRAVVKSLLERVRARFNVAAAEVGALDDHHRAELAFAVVSNSGKHASAMTNKVAVFCEENANAEVGGIHVEIVPMGKPVGDLLVPRDDWQLPARWQESESTEEPAERSACPNARPGPAR